MYSYPPPPFFFKLGRLFHLVTRLLHPNYTICLDGVQILLHYYSIHFPYRKLNTGIRDISGLKCIDFGEYDHLTFTIDDIVKDIFLKAPLSTKDTYIGTFIQAGVYKIIVQPYLRREYSSAIVFGYGTKGILFYVKVNGTVYRYTTNWNAAII